jgi:hypothetical protein
MAGPDGVVVIIDDVINRDALHPAGAAALGSRARITPGLVESDPEHQLSRLMDTLSRVVESTPA